MQTIYIVYKTNEVSEDGNYTYERPIRITINEELAKQEVAELKKVTGEDNYRYGSFYLDDTDVIDLN